MAGYIAARLLSLLLTLLVASLVIFAIVQVIPGDPARTMLGLNATPEAIAALKSELGLEGGARERYVAWVSGLSRGDFGLSYTYRVPVGDLVLERIIVSLPLALFALALAVAVALPLGLVAAARRGSLVDTLVLGLIQIGIALPNFWFAILLVLLFSVTLGWTRAGGFPGWSEGLGPALGALVLPAIALALPQAAILTRILRSSLIESLSEDYIRTARAKGLSAGAALRAHALPNALIPVLTIVGLQFAFLLAGGIIIENVFFLPGLGRLVFQAIAQRDLVVVQGVVLLLVFAVVTVNFLVDLSYALIDPRIGSRP